MFALTFVSGTVDTIKIVDVESPNHYADEAQAIEAAKDFAKLHTAKTRKDTKIVRFTREGMGYKTTPIK
jgi:hypothetical protein